MNKLPFELLQQICSVLCPHCTNIDDNDHFSSRQALASLSRTSHLLCAIAQPTLFHRLKIPTKSTCAFLRMLYERPYLASSVRQLRPLRYGFFFDGSDEDIQALKRAARELLLDIDGDPDFKKSYGDNYQKDFLTELAIALLPNLEAFVTEIEYDMADEDLVTTNRFLDSRFKRLAAKQQPGLSHIRALGFAKEDNWGFNLATPGIAVLLNAAPNLERLVFDGTHGVGTLHQELMAPALRNLRVLSITNSALGNGEDDFEFRQLRRVVQLCTRLETFRFHSVGPFLGEMDEGLLPPAKFLEALEPVSEKLKVLDLDLTESHHPGPPEDWILTRQSFASFTRLESLHLDGFSFCHHFVDIAMNEGPRSSTTCLTDILPPTVRFLTVMLVHEGRVWDDLCHLGRVADTEFPRLETVTIEREDVRDRLLIRALKRKVREAFEQSRARLSITEKDYHDGNVAFEDVYNYNR